MKIIGLKAVKLHNAGDTILEKDKLYGHTNEDKPPELLIEHLDRTNKYFSRLTDKKNIDGCLDCILCSLKFGGSHLSRECLDFIKELFVNAVYLHDLGKINPVYQYEVLHNEPVYYEKRSQNRESRHSDLSALLYIHIYLKRIGEFHDRYERSRLRFILLCFSYAISRHHTYLDNIMEKEFADSLGKFHKRLKCNPLYLRFYREAEDFKKGLDMGLFGRGRCVFDEHSPFEVYVLTKLLYSSIVCCDYYAAHEYFTGNEPDFKYIDDVDSIIETYRNTDTFKGIEKYKRDKGFFGQNSINSLRCEMFNEAEQSLLNNMDKNIFYLEAPTGSGKTNTSINLALTIIKQNPRFNKIVYVFPFNTLVEQTKNVLDRMLNGEGQDKTQIAVINSITPIITNKEGSLSEDTIDYKKDYLNRQMLHYPITLTTHVNFFNYLFGTGREINLPLVHMCNSVVILDEIQSYRNRIWTEIITFLEKYGRLLNMKIIIMSATLPKLDRLLNENKNGFVELIKNKNSYYQDPVFKDRVIPVFDMLEIKDGRKSIFNEIIRIIECSPDKRMLVEFITKNTAREFYNAVTQRFPNRNIKELTGDDSNFVREKVIGEINGVDENGKFKCRDIVLVATQVIEAGVDIDMDMGFKDISILDGEEQFLGRINRSAKKDNSCAWFFNLDNASKVYKGDFRLEMDLRDYQYQQYLIDKNFNEFYKKCLDGIKESKDGYGDGNIENLHNYTLSLSFKKISEMMRLITEKNYQVYLAHKIPDGATGTVLFDGRSTWEKYKELIHDNDMDYSKKKIKMSELAQEMSYFIYKFTDWSSSIDKTPKRFDDNIGSIYYIENGDEFITADGKFDRAKYQEASGGLFL